MFAFHFLNEKESLIYTHSFNILLKHMLLICEFEWKPIYEKIKNNVINVLPCFYPLSLYIFPYSVANENELYFPIENANLDASTLSCVELCPLKEILTRFFTRNFNILCEV